ncbi:PGPGW domain-containing protein [Streptomyces capitiformicae]|uniref:Uncharacterized protein n=1 Tax=Streptomyces capitiformicae TaxID=2014920 RepID=A0A918ZPF4_9ACTN|nr:PGPGW domain-containing protein [Streptomyces capitiformicae]GHE63089.1 hypothetical protein GCM10017771_86420 [Streptomyces capitiformicae]
MGSPLTRRTVARSLATAGTALALCGVVMWVLPGPGLPVLLLGILCLAVAGALRLTNRPK